MPWETPDLETNEDAVIDRILDGLIDRLDGWQPVEGAPEVALAEELGREIAVLNQSTVSILELAIAGIGETAFGFPSIPAAAADIQVELTLASAGTIIPDGFAVYGINDNGDEIAFILDGDTPAAGTTQAVTMTATQAGAAGNTVPVGPLTIITATSNVVSAAATSTSAGGTDAETITAYLERLTDYLGTLRPGGVNATDLAALARSVPGVHRALGVDLYNPADPLTPSERTVTVFCVDDTGHPVTAPIATQVQNVLEAAREVNFIVHVEDPTYTPLALVYEVVAEAGANPVTVEAEVDVALANWLTTWGSTTDDEQAWIETTTARVFDAIRVIGSAPGVAYINTLTINGGTVDVTLDGPAALPTPLDDPTTPSTISGTVV